MRPLGFNDTNAGSFDSLFEMSTKWGSYGRPVSSSIIETGAVGRGGRVWCKRSDKMLASAA